MRHGCGRLILLQGTYHNLDYSNISSNLVVAVEVEFEQWTFRKIFCTLAKDPWTSSVVNHIGLS